MFVKLNSNNTLPDNVYVNNNQDKVLYVNSILVNSNVASKTLVVSYANGGGTITTITTEIGVKRYNLSGVVARGNVGKDIQVTINQGLTASENINLIMDIDSITDVPST